MSAPSEPIIPAVDWMADHVKSYLASDGKEGHLWRGVPTLILTTTGRKSNAQRLIPLIYGQDGDRYIVIGSKGGAEHHPEWYRNLMAHPEVGVQVAAERFQARARIATAEERPALWKKMTGIFPNYNEYQAKTAREIPVVVLERVAG